MKKKKKWRREGRGGEGAGWWRERDSSERTEMKRIRMEEKTIAMEGEKGNGEVKTEKRRRKKKSWRKGAKGSQEEAGSVFSCGATRRKWPVSDFQR